MPCRNPFVDALIFQHRSRAADQTIVENYWTYAAVISFQDNDLKTELGSFSNFEATLKQLKDTGVM